MPNTNSADPLKSPCIRNCCLNELDICLGCFRHIDEIVGWQSFDKDKKQAVLVQCERREQCAKKAESKT